MIKRLAKSLLIRIKYSKIRFYHIGNGCEFKSLKSTFSSAENISIGDDVHIGPEASIDGAGGVVIGEGTIFAPRVTLLSRTHNFRYELSAVPFDNVVLVAPIVIGRYVWIGQGAIILPGVTIGDGAIIGAGAVVHKDIPSCSVHAGNPAQRISTRDKKQFERLAENPENFVYRKFGHRKIARKKSECGTERGNNEG